jgi:hypothetical protein
MERASDSWDFESVYGASTGVRKPLNVILDRPIAKNRPAPAPTVNRHSNTIYFSYTIALSVTSTFADALMHLARRGCTRRSSDAIGVLSTCHRCSHHIDVPRAQSTPSAQWYRDRSGYARSIASGVRSCASGIARPKNPFRAI